MRTRFYRCHSCGATKEISFKDPFMVADFPDKVPCVWRGCEHYATPVIPDNSEVCSCFPDIVKDESIPKNEAHLMQDNKLVAIINLGEEE